MPVRVGAQHALYLSTTIHLPIGEELFKMWPLMQDLSSPQFPPILF